jgi:hypothetical protein
MKEAKVTELHKCDICKNIDAQYDAKTIHGPWGYLCQSCFDQIGLGLGLGLGQKLVLVS